jgi:hypothetical protein
MQSMLAMIEAPAAPRMSQDRFNGGFPLQLNAMASHSFMLSLKKSQRLATHLRLALVRPE